jgi:lipid-binding SYLF domain-containing protein
MIKSAAFMLAFAVASLLAQGSASAASSTNKPTDKEVKAALSALYEHAPTSKALGAKAKGILVFPTVRRAGLVVGGQHGDGALLKKGKIAGYYTTSAVSVGLEAGAQSFSYALLFMTDDAMRDFEKSNGFEIGAGANVVFVDAGAAAAGSSATAKADVYGFVFGQKGLMAGASLQGAKITKVDHAR